MSPWFCCRLVLLHSCLQKAHGLRYIKAAVCVRWLSLIFFAARDRGADNPPVRLEHWGSANFCITGQTSLLSSPRGTRALSHVGYTLGLCTTALLSLTFTYSYHAMKLTRDETRLIEVFSKNTRFRSKWISNIYPTKLDELKLRTRKKQRSCELLNNYKILTLPCQLDIITVNILMLLSVHHLIPKLINSGHKQAI